MTVSRGVDYAASGSAANNVVTKGLMFCIRLKYSHKHTFALYFLIESFNCTNKFVCRCALFEIRQYPRFINHALIA